MGLLGEIMFSGLIGDAIGTSIAINKMKEKLEEAKAEGDVKKIKEIEEKLKNMGA